MNVCTNEAMHGSKGKYECMICMNVWHVSMHVSMHKWHVWMHVMSVWMHGIMSVWMQWKYACM